mgnify:CR=1 FL=1
MKKLLLGAFLLVSVLSFSAERVVKLENAYVDDKGIVYVIGEKAPFTGIVENYKVPPISEGDSVLEGKIPFKNGVMEGYSKLYYPSGKLLSEVNFKNDKEEGMMKSYYESGKLQGEIPYKNGQVEGVVKAYDENGKLIEQAVYKNGEEVK